MTFLQLDPMVCLHEVALEVVFGGDKRLPKKTKQNPPNYGHYRAQTRLQQSHWDRRSKNDIAEI